jgi:selenocysteine-specific elongation factor
LERRVSGAVETQHREHPNQPGLPLNEVKALLALDVRWPEMLSELIGGLAGAGFEQAGTHLRKRDHRPVLPPHLEVAGTRLRSTLAAKPLDPPSRKELAPDPSSQQALRFLLQTGEAVELGPDLVLSAAAYGSATSQIRRHLELHTSATASELRQLLHTSRRILIPLLERMDREGITRRDGDRRQLKG